MDISEKIIESVNYQFKFNSKKNLFYFDRGDVMKLSPEVLKFMKLNRSDIIDYFETGDLLKIMDYLTEKALEVFWTSNQYLDFREDDRENLKNIYQIYLYELYSALRSDSGIEVAAGRHYERLKTWIENANPFILNLNRKEEKYIPEIVCAEYSEQLQLSILDIDLEALMEPVIDIGCGKSGRIVKYLRAKGIAAFGLDRLYLPNDDFFIRGSWFEFKFEKEHWGSIVSNMSFANHFIGNHLRKDGNYIEYAEKYNEILNALKIGGSFYYAPGLPFIEQYLSKDRFVVDNKAIHGKINLTRSIVRKIK